MNSQPSHVPSPLHPAQGQADPRRVMILLSLIMALQMTGFVMIQPLYARRFSEFGAGVEALGTSAMIYALAATVAAPFMGALADRFGRRPLVIGSLLVYVLAFSGYLFTSSALVFILLRGLAGAFTAGLVPALTGIVADLAPGERRAQWIGIVNGGASIGWIAGPPLGGLLYDRLGYGLPFGAAILITLISLLIAFLAVPETHPPRTQAAGSAPAPLKKESPGGLKAASTALRTSLPGSFSTLLILLGITFATLFAWAFIEPTFMFYAYDNLDWSSSMLGLVMSVYGITMTLGEFGLSRLSDRWGRKPVILLGLALFSAQFVGLAFSGNYVFIAVSFAIAGLGNALFDPALSATLLEIIPADQRARLLGFKSTAGSLGSILGPALVVLVTPFVSAQGVFWIAGGIVLVTVLSVLFARITVK